MWYHGGKTTKGEDRTMPQQFPGSELNHHLLKIQNDLFRCDVFWARVVRGESENRLTRYTKHTFYEIQYALEGGISMIMGDNTPLDLAESDFIVVPPDTFHQIVDCPETGARFIMAFSLESEKATIARAIEAMAAPLPRRESPQLRALLELMLHKAQDASALCAPMLTGLAECFLLELLELLSPPEPDAPSEGSLQSENEQRVEEIMAFIRATSGVGLGVADLARRFNFSTRHLNRLFTTATGRPTREAINYEKLRHIEELTASTALSFNEIAALCGFSDEYAMNKFFRRYEKVNLSAYRRTAKKG